MKSRISGWGLNNFSYTNLITFEKTNKRNYQLFNSGSNFIPRGLGRSYGDAAQLTGGDTVLSGDTTGYILDEENGILNVSAGADFDFLIRELVPRGWFLPVVPGTRYITVGGAIAADIHGKNHHRDGSFGNFIYSFELLTPNGKISCSAFDNTELFFATIGGMGLTGLILSAKIELIKIETSLIKGEIIKFKNINDLLIGFKDYDEKYKYSVAWVDLLAKGNSLGRGILSLGNHAKTSDLNSKSASDIFYYRANQKISIPFYLPTGTLNSLTTNIFNKLWYLKDKKQSKKLFSIPSFFHPLDGIKNWNKIYGKQGFLQYQFVVPDTRSEFLIEVIKKCSNQKIPIFLAVLKKMGASNGGLLSFGKPGWTLTLDIPMRTPNLENFLNDLDEDVVANEGRIYLAKDSLLNPTKFNAMYSNSEKFRALRTKGSFNNFIQSDLSRRLSI